MAPTDPAATPIVVPPAAGGSAPRRRAGRPAAPPVTLVDWVMLLLAVISVGLLAWITFWDVDPDVASRVVAADIAICGVFLVEFCWRWRRSGMGPRFVRSYWYEVLGMIPLAHPAFRGFRLLRIVVIVARLGRAADRAFGDRVTVYLVARFADTVVDVIRRPVTVAVLDEVIAVIQTGNYTRHVATAIDENRAELDALILDLIREDQATGKLRFVPFHDDVVRLVADTVFRIAEGALADPRVHELISDAIRESATELRANVGARMHEAVRDDVGKVGVR
ncbi:ion transporter [Nocardioides sp. SYSU DS0651]|uniref:ion transporter n=1 Tax=Nocardioides sp. SYSU DS0651 TaxID=3415955 RepID=UPI003F4B9CF0